MYQTRIDKIFEGKPLEGLIPSENSSLTHSIIEQYRRKDKIALEQEIHRIKRRLTLLDLNFPKTYNLSEEILRKFVLLIQILTNTIEKALSLPPFDFSWESLLENLLHLERDPNFLIRSMLREKRRYLGYKSYLNWKIKKMRSLDEDIFQFSKLKQVTLIRYFKEYLSPVERSYNSGIQRLEKQNNTNEISKE